MKHALVIGVDHKSADVVRHVVGKAGYRSILWAENEDEAWAMIGAIGPSLIIIAPDCQPTIPIESMIHMSDTTDAPVVVATAGLQRALKCLGPSLPLESRHPMAEVEGHLGTACEGIPRIAEAV